MEGYALFFDFSLNNSLMLSKCYDYNILESHRPKATANMPTTTLIVK